jgi:catechol 2,3-dioxygenase-like lactoylglutathione lyase family enzyme
MFAGTRAYSGFAVDDFDKAREFYGETLGLPVTVVDEGNLMTIELAGGRDTLIYHSPSFTPGSYTILNFEVDDIEAAVDELVSRGVEFERYNGMEQDERGIAHVGPDIAWFKDPAGNILSVIQAS